MADRQQSECRERILLIIGKQCFFLHFQLGRSSFRLHVVRYFADRKLSLEVIQGLVHSTDIAELRSRETSTAFSLVGTEMGTVLRHSRMGFPSINNRLSITVPPISPDAIDIAYDEREYHVVFHPSLSFTDSTPMSLRDPDTEAAINTGSRTHVSALINEDLSPYKRDWMRAYGSDIWIIFSPK